MQKPHDRMWHVIMLYMPVWCLHLSHTFHLHLCNGCEPVDNLTVCSTNVFAANMLWLWLNGCPGREWNKWDSIIFNQALNIHVKKQKHKTKPKNKWNINSTSNFLNIHFEHLHGLQIRDGRPCLVSTFGAQHASETNAGNAVCAFGCSKAKNGR